MMQFKGAANWLLVLLVTTIFAFAGTAMGKDDKDTQKPPEEFSCVAEGKLEKIIATGIGLEGFSCFYKKWEGASTLHFKVTIKNNSDKPQRFKVNIFLNNGKAVGGLIPRKTADGLVEPGKTASFVYPVKGMAEKPEAVTLKISTIDL